jgi:hypothetical protein
LEKARTPEQVLAALEAIPETDPRLRAAILRRYQAIASQKPPKDQGGAVRTALLKALRPLAHKDDIPVLEAALWTYEFMPNPGGERDEVAGGLRGLALVVLNDTEPGLAAFHACRLLFDPCTSRFSGEPALTAVRVLSQEGQLLPLYAFALRGGSGEVLAECFRGLAIAPTPIVRRLVETHISGADEIALIGLIDLLVAHTDHASFQPILLNFLRQTPMTDVYRYGVTAVVAARRQDLVVELRAMADAETRTERATILREALSLGV